MSNMDFILQRQHFGVTAADSVSKVICRKRFRAPSATRNGYDIRTPNCYQTVRTSAHRSRRVTVCVPVLRDERVTHTDTRDDQLIAIYNR